MRRNGLLRQLGQPAGWLCLILLLLLSACRDSPDAATTLTPESTVAADVPDSTPLPVPSGNTGFVTVDAAPTLTVWIPDNLAANPAASDSIGATLQRQLDGFGSTNDIDVALFEKAAEGPASILGYLETAGEVAPGILPDLALVPATLLSNDIVQGGIVTPISLPEEVTNQWYSGAAELGQIDTAQGDSMETLAGAPYMLDLLDVVFFDSGEISGTFPVTWDAMTSSRYEELNLLIAADTDTSSRILLQLYFAAGGTLMRNAETNRWEVERGAMLAAIEPVQDALALLRLSTLRFSATTLVDANNSFATGSANSIITSSSDYLSTPNPLVNSVAPAPGITEPLTPQMTGWVWVIVNKEGQPATGAIDLLAYLMTPENVVEVVAQSAYLPAGRNAVAQLPLPTNNLAIDALLESAAAYPTSLATAPLAEFELAMSEVLTTSRSASEIVDALQFNLSDLAP